MNYKKHYTKLIERAKNRKLEGYKEKHHIIPRCMGGSNDKENLVELTAREHFIAHQLLVKIYPEDFRLIKAVNMMCVVGERQKERRVYNRRYGWLKEKHSKIQSDAMKGEKNPSYGTFWIYNLELKKSKKIPISEPIPEGWVKGRVINFNNFKPKKKIKLLK